MSTKIDLAKAWVPPGRPEWLQRMNEEGNSFDLKSVVPLDSKSLIDAAKRNTGLSDFGDDQWREPFEIIVRAFDEEANLNLMGRLMTRSDMLNFLQGRLQIEESYKLHPEIDEEEIVKPFIIVGQGRSGTSALLNVMAKDPDSGSVKTWEAIFPCPAPEKDTYRSDPRVAHGHDLIDQWNRVSPALETLHEFAGEVPASCVHFMTYNFMSIWFNQLGQIPTYSAYCAKADWHGTFEYHKRVLKLLQWRNPRKHWVLKSPTHLRMMPTILDIYPDACFVWPHRDPLKAIVSSTDLAGNFIWARSDNVRMEGFEEYNRPERAVGMIEEPIEWLESGRLPKERLCNIQYVDFISDTVGTVEKIYHYFDVEFTAEARATMEKYMAERPRSSRPPHTYNKDIVEAVSKEREIFRRYQDYFQVPTELK